MHMLSVHVICIDGTYQVRPRNPSDITQLLTIQIVFINVVCIHALLIDHSISKYILRVMQFLIHDLQLNLPYNGIQNITDYEQGLRNAKALVTPEAINT